MFVLILIIMTEGIKAEQEQQEFLEWLRGVQEGFQEEFNLSEEDLRTKKILDVGACDMRNAASCLLNGTSKEIYSLEPGLVEDQEQAKKFLRQPELTREVLERLPTDMRKQIEQKTVVATAEETPFDNNSFDLVIVGFVPFESKQQLSDRLHELLRISAEVRIYPIADKDRDAYQNVLAQMAKELDLEVEFVTQIEREVKTESGTEIKKDELLILRRKNKKT